MLPATAQLPFDWRPRKIVLKFCVKPEPAPLEAGCQLARKFCSTPGVGWPPVEGAAGTVAPGVVTLPGLASSESVCCQLFGAAAALEAAGAAAAGCACCCAACGSEERPSRGSS